MRAVISALICFCAAPVWAGALSADQKGYVASNTIGIFYHELGHALVDILGLRIRGREEDAVDTLSILMVDWGYEPKDAVQIADDIALTFTKDAQTSRPSFFWEAHSSDAKRAEQTVCLFYGGDPEARSGFADDWDLPERKRARCVSERDEAEDQWAPVLDEIETERRGVPTLTFAGIPTKSEAAKIGARVVRDEVRHLNGWMRLPEPLSVRIDYCGESNAFYDPEHREIVMCAEYSDYLAEQLN